MNRQQLEDLSLEELQIEVAKALGWTNLSAFPRDMFGEYEAGVQGTDPKGIADEPLDYPNDLNACAEFERDMTEIQFCKYCMILCDHTTKGEKITWSGYDVAKVVRATARQRCVAFLMTIAEN